MTELERRVIRERTKARLQELKNNNIKLGRPVRAHYHIVCDLRAKGLSLRGIGRQIGAHRSTVCKVLGKGSRSSKNAIVSVVP